jgi:hypothetical protein
LFYQPDFVLPADFDELAEEDLKAWNGESE